MMKKYNRYKKFINNGEVALTPFIEIPKKSTDLYDTYIVGESRLDIMSYQYYNDPNYGWLILMANPEYGSLEYKIPNNTMLRIPYPLETTLAQYEDGIELYRKLYGN